MDKKTIKVDGAVHDRLEELKMAHSVDTFNDVLRHELGLVAPPDVDELAAFLHIELKQLAGEVVETINNIGEFEQRVTEEGKYQVLEFIDKDTNSLIAAIQFDEHSFQVKYRSQEGEMKNCGKGRYSSTCDEPEYGRKRNTSKHNDPQNVVEQVEKKVGGAYCRWVK